jgi:hypothetical protein
MIRPALLLAALLAAAPLRAQDADSLAARGRLGEALAAAEARAAAAPDDGEAQLAAARLHLRLSQAEAAEPYLARVEAMDSARTGPGAYALVLRGSIAYARGDAGAARDRWAAVEMLSPAPEGAQDEARRLLWRADVPEGWETFPNPGLLIHTPPLHEFPRVNEAISSRLRAYMGLAPFFTTAEDKRIDLWVWPSAQSMRSAGRQALEGFVDPVLALAHTTLDAPPGYEIARVLLHRAAHPTYENRFITEGTATLFDMTDRDRIAVARQAVRGQRRVTVRRLWAGEGRQDDAVVRAVGAAFVERLVKEAGRDRFLAFLRDQSPENARAVYGAETLDRIVAAVDADLRRR